MAIDVLFPPSGRSIKQDSGATDVMEERLVSTTDLLRLALSSWRALLFAMSVGLAGGVLVGFLAKPVYSGTVLVAVEQDVSGGLAAALGGELGALASLAGVNVGQAGSRKAEYLALLRSESTTLRFLRQQGLVDMMYALSRRGLVRAIASPPWILDDRDSPDVQEKDAANFFRERLLNVGEDKKTGLVAVRVESDDPVRAAEWANSFVALFNEDARLRESQGAEARLKYLEAELGRSRPTEIRDSIGRLIEAELNTIMITNVQRDFALRVVEPASASPVPRPDRPKRAQLAVFGAFLGMFVGLILVLARRRREWLPGLMRESTSSRA